MPCLVGGPRGIGGPAGGRHVAFELGHEVLQPRRLAGERFRALPLAVERALGGRLRRLPGRDETRQTSPLGAERGGLDPERVALPRDEGAEPAEFGEIGTQGFGGAFETRHHGTEQHRRPDRAQHIVGAGEKSGQGMQAHALQRSQHLRGLGAAAGERPADGVLASR